MWVPEDKMVSEDLYEVKINRKKTSKIIETTISSSKSQTRALIYSV